MVDVVIADLDGRLRYKAWLQRGNLPCYFVDGYGWRWLEAADFAMRRLACAFHLLQKEAPDD